MNLLLYNHVLLYYKLIINTASKNRKFTLPLSEAPEHPCLSDL